MTKLPALVAFTIATCAAQVAVGITIGAPPPPRAVVVRPGESWARFRLAGRLLVRGKSGSDARITNSCKAIFG
jgi:hypothetical protein